MHIPYHGTEIYLQRQNKFITNRKQFAKYECNYVCHGYRGGEPFQLRKKNKKKQKERKKSFEHFT